MSVYIKDIPFPKRGQILCINISDDGKVTYSFDLACKQIATAVEVPPHGRLIDADEMLGHRFVGVVGEAEKSSYMVGWNTAIEAIVENAPTIIPADPAEEGM